MGVRVQAHGVLEPEEGVGLSENSFLIPLFFPGDHHLLLGLGLDMIWNRHRLHREQLKEQELNEQGVGIRVLEYEDHAPYTPSPPLEIGTENGKTTLRDGSPDT